MITGEPKFKLRIVNGEPPPHIRGPKSRWHEVWERVAKLKPGQWLVIEPESPSDLRQLYASANGNRHLNMEAMKRGKCLWIKLIKEKS